MKEAICRAGINVPSPHEIAQQLSVPPQAVEEIVRLGIEARELVRIAEGITYTQDQLEGFKSEVRKLGSPFAASDFRDVTGSTRKYVIPLLEYFDATGFTMRQGDKRIVK